MTQDNSTRTSTAEPLRLLAMDEEDLAVISAHLQDAVVRVGDMAFLPRERRFALVAKRFDWVACECERCLTGLHFEDVAHVSHVGLDPARPNDVLNLLSIVFTPGESPTGTVTLTFSGGAAVRLEVECLEAQMRDMGPRWAARHRPGHSLEENTESE